MVSQRYSRSNQVGDVPRMSDKLGSYFCDKCERYHGIDTKVGYDHAVFSRYLSVDTIRETQLERPQPWMEEDQVMVCIHVLEELDKPEYAKEDDSYTCSRCRDSLAKDGFDAVKELLTFVHRIHLSGFIVPTTIKVRRLKQR